MQVTQNQIEEILVKLGEQEQEIYRLKNLVYDMQCHMMDQEELERELTWAYKQVGYGRR